MKFGYWFYDEVYFQNFYFLCGMTKEEVIEYIKEESGVDHELTCGIIDGRNIEVTSDDGHYRIFIVIHECGLDTRTITALAHESLHAANRVLSKRGVAVDLLNDEAQTYYMGYIFNKCLDEMKRNLQLREKELAELSTTGGT